MTSKPKAKKRAARQKTTVQTDRGPKPQTEEVGETGQPAEGVSNYEPTRVPLENAGFDHHAAEEQRQAELAEQREEHNRRTAGQAA